MRAADQARDFEQELAVQELGESDPFLTGRIYLVLKQILRS